MFESNSGSSSVTGPGSSLDKSDSSDSSSDSGEDRKRISKNLKKKVEEQRKRKHQSRSRSQTQNQNPILMTAEVGGRAKVIAEGAELDKGFRMEYFYVCVLLPTWYLKVVRVS